MSARILIIDDEQSICKLLLLLLRLEGHEPLAVSEFEDAVEAIKNQPFDLIISDIMLGGQSGIDLLKIVKKARPETPVVMLTGHPTIENAARSVRHGAFDYLVKPVEKEKLLRAVEVGLRHKAALDRREKAEQSLEKSRMELETVFQSIPEGILTVDAELTVIRKNRAMDKICPLSDRMIPGTRMVHPMAPGRGCPGECAKILDYTIQKRKTVREYRLDCEAASSPRHLVLTCAPMGGPDDQRGEALLVIRDVTRIRDLEAQVRRRASEGRIIGQSDKMRHVHALIDQLADLDSTVLITGESGTGKELVMEALHAGGRRRGGPLVRVNCSALPEHLILSELFGHARGAFTGAVKDRVGRFQAAEGGTLFLDEIGDLPLHIQVKLLRALERKEFERVGENRTIKADVRIIAATHLNLARQVQIGAFREDFYYRLNVINIHLPPLRERPEDITELVNHFQAQFGQTFNKRFEGFSDEVMSIFLNHSWPGNVRELKHAVEHACILCSGGAIGTAHLASGFFRSNSVNVATRKNESSDPASSPDDILKTLSRTDGNKAKAARLLGVSRSTLYRRMRQHGLG